MIVEDASPHTKMGMNNIGQFKIGQYLGGMQILIDYYYGDRPPPIIFPAKFSAENAEPKVCTVFGDSAANFLNLNTHKYLAF